MARLKYNQQEGENTFASGESPLNRVLDMTAKIGRDNLTMPDAPRDPSLAPNEDYLNPWQSPPSDWEALTNMGNGRMKVRRSLENLSPKQLRARGVK